MGSGAIRAEEAHYSGMKHIAYYSINISLFMCQGMSSSEGGFIF